MSAVFKGSRLKIKRANQHISELNNVLNAFVETDFYAFDFHKDEKVAGNQVLKFSLIKDIPCETSLIIGDAIHNMRSALDLAQCELVTHVGGAPTDYTKFIFRETRKELVDALNGGELKRAPDMIDFIADVIKPYATGNNPLYALHTLDIADKHLILLPVFSIGSVRINMDIKNFRTGGVGYIRDMLYVVDSGGEVHDLSIPDGFEYECEYQPAINVVFGKGQALAGEAIMPTLHQLSQLVSGILDALEKALLARK